MITGSVVATWSSAGAQKVTLPNSGMTIVAINDTGTWLSIPLDPSHQSIIHKSGGTATPPNGAGFYRRVHFTVKGNELNFFSPETTGEAIFYYGDGPLADSIPLEQLTAVTAQVTLSGGAGTASLKFPSGELRLTGMSALDETADKTIALAFATSTGQTLTVVVPANALSYMSGSNIDIAQLNLVVSETLSVSVTGTSSDVIDVFAFYQ